MDDDFEYLCHRISLDGFYWALACMSNDPNDDSRYVAYVSSKPDWIGDELAGPSSFFGGRAVDALQAAFDYAKTQPEK